MMKLLKNIFDVVIALIKLIYTLIYVVIDFWFLSLFSEDETEEKINYNKEKKEFEDRYKYLKKLKEKYPKQFKKEYRYYIATGHIPKGVKFK